MKQRLLGLVMVLAAVQAQAKTFEGVQYTASCRFDHPLSTYDGCFGGTHAGEMASICAENEARVQCKSEYSSDCVVVGRKFKTIISQEFLGYKACEATVIVHGYRLAR